MQISYRRDCHSCHRRWEVRLRRALETETPTPVDKSIVESPCRTSSPGIEEQAHFCCLSKHSSSCLTVAWEGKSVVEETSHLATRRRCESSTRDLEKGKPDLVKFSILNADSHLRRSALCLAAAPLKAEEPSQPSTKGFQGRSSTAQNRKHTEQESAPLTPPINSSYRSFLFLFLSISSAFSSYGILQFYLFV